MIHETDLPCSDCETQLVERNVSAGEVSISTSTQEAISVAECPDCGARYYPTETLSRLTDTGSDSRPRTDT